MAKAQKIYDKCLTTTAKCIAACERCAAECGTAGDREREKCAAMSKDCADIGRLAEALMLRDSPYAAEACALHAQACQACADLCAKFSDACCRDCAAACRACAAECLACSKGA